MDRMFVEGEGFVIYKRDFLEWVTTGRSEFAFALLDIEYPLHHSIINDESNLFMFCCVREE